ncbi:hypothetical protein SAMN02910456_02226 [Ruminococcaceae bacterium YRB3002]|nr:hypothetical protein SAMN02910456_02226 [Ruminococcaceae bacterium YRB3002]
MHRKLMAGILMITMLAGVAGAAACDLKIPGYSGETMAPAESIEDTDDTELTEDTDAPAPDEPASTPLPDSDEVVFRYTNYNFAWGEQAFVMLITCKGDIYAFNNGSVTGELKHGNEENALAYLRKYAKPTGYINPAVMENLYSVCLALNPDAPTEMVGTANDMGQHEFVYIDQETGRQITLFNEGDSTMKTTDPALQEAGQLAMAVLQKIPSPAADYKLALDPERCINVPCDPDTPLIGTHLVVDDYDELVRFCGIQKIDIGPYISDDMRTRLEKATYILLQFSDGYCITDGILVNGDSELRLLPSLADYELDPAFAGKGTVAIVPMFDSNDPLKMLDEEGHSWVGVS